MLPARCPHGRQPEEHLLPSPAKKALTSLDERVENATGRSVDELWSEAGLLDAATVRVVTAHRELSEATRTVTFNRTLLHRLTSGETAVDALLLKRIDHACDQLEQAVGRRDLLTADLLHVLRPLEEAAQARTRDAGVDLDPSAFAALAAIASGGAIFREHLLHHRLAVICASGNRITGTMLQRLETQGLVTRDESRPLHVGQPVTLTEAGRNSLSRARKATVVKARARHTGPTAARLSDVARPQRR
ncbi:hypothetical protein [Streptomyces nigrescens]|uniref:hypothetical protein n=1 Tax=Streptomyces nigrescens TaxID=1920 RepID=UPI0036F7AF40